MAQPRFSLTDFVAFDKAWSLRSNTFSNGTAA
jgi:hypothetical protein